MYFQRDGKGIPYLLGNSCTMETDSFEAGGKTETEKIKLSYFIKKDKGEATPAFCSACPSRPTDLNYQPHHQATLGQAVEPMLLRINAGLWALLGHASISQVLPLLRTWVSPRLPHSSSLPLNTDSPSQARPTGAQRSQAVSGSLIAWGWISKVLSRGAGLISASMGFMLSWGSRFCPEKHQSPAGIPAWPSQPCPLPLHQRLDSVFPLLPTSLSHIHAESLY